MPAMANLRRSMAINFMSSTGGTIVQFIVSLILARMLSPSEIGVFSMTVVFVNIAQIFRDFGVSTYLQREETLTPEKIASASGVMFAASWTIALSLYLVSGHIAVWFSEPTMAPVMQVLALGFLIIPFGAITNALLLRELAAGKEALLMVTGTSAYTVTCLALAYSGHGTMSLAWANFANIFACALVCIPLRPKGIPFFPSFRRWGKVVNFGFASLLANVLNAVNNAVPDILLGKLADSRAVGLFSRAGSTVAIFYTIAGSTLNYGTLPFISRAYHRGEDLSPILSRASGLLTGIGWPALGFTAIFGTEIITTLYGEKWLGSVPALTALTLSAAVGMAFNYSSLAMIAIGRPYLSSLPNLVTVLARIGFGIALFNGSIQAFSWAILIATVASTPVLIYQQRRYLRHGVRAMASALWPSVQVTVLCMIAVEAMRLAIGNVLGGLSLIVAVALPLTVIWYFALRFASHPLLEEVHLLGRTLRTRLTGRPA
jgi:O-antigen/teichoic acid export membrane protein